METFFKVEGMGMAEADGHHMVRQIAESQAPLQAHNPLAGQPRAEPAEAVKVFPQQNFQVLPLAQRLLQVPTDLQ